MLKAIVFDFDGVIVDSEPLHYRAFLLVAQTLGIEFTYQRYLDEYIGYDDRDAFRAMLQQRGNGAAMAHDPATIARLCGEKAEAFAAVVHEGIEPIPGVLELIGNAAAAMPVAIASGATTRDIDLILYKLDLVGRFDPIVSADHVARSKPDPASYALAVQRLAQKHPDLKLQPGECLSIEDTAAGIESARGAGLQTLGLTSTGSRDKLHRAHRVIDTLEGVSVQMLHKWFG